MTIRSKLTALLILTALVPLLACMGVALRLSSGHVKDLTIQSAQERATASGLSLSVFFEARCAEARAYASMPLIRAMDWPQIEPYLVGEMDRLGEVYGKFALGRIDGSYYVTPGGNPHHGGLASVDRNDPQANLVSLGHRPFFQELVVNNVDHQHRITVSNPMVSQTNGKRQVLVGASIHDDDEQIIGMIGGTIPWKQIEVQVQTIRDQITEDFGPDVRVALIDAKGIYVYHWDPEKVIRLKQDANGEPIIDAYGKNEVVLHQIQDEPVAQVAGAWESMSQGRADHIDYLAPQTNQAMTMVYAPVSSAGYTVIVEIPRSVVMTPVSRMRQVFGGLLVIFSLLCLVIALVLARRVVQPVISLHAAATRISTGDLNTRVEVATRDEIGQLGHSFNKMAADLGEHIERLAQERASRAKIEHDLQIARDIQQALLPTDRPELPGFDIAGWNQPADATGGDYYDWQQLPDGRWAITLADVTGHGIGPAIVTAVCRAYSRATFPGHADLKQSLREINQLIHHDLPPGRFITFVVGILDPATNKITLLSAGHGPQCVLRVHDQQVERHMAHGLPLGIDRDDEYEEPLIIDLDVGDALILFTDGFFEWSPPNGKQFGLDRMDESFRQASELSAQDTIQAIYKQVKAHVGDAPQGDDLTAVVIKRTGPEEA